MFRLATAYLLSLLIALTSYTLADARGASHDIGNEIAICSGMGMTTITVGPNGQPIEMTELCPDGSSAFVADFALPALPAPEARFLAWLAPRPSAALTEHPELSPSARGPPALA